MRRLFRVSFGERGVRKDVASEIQFHIDMRARELIAAGVPPDRARAEAIAAFGSVPAIEEECRDERRRVVRANVWSEGFWALVRDVQYAGRTLWRARGFTIAALATLALGIGANSAIFSMVNGVLLRRLPYANADRLVLISHPVKSLDIGDIGFAPLEKADFKAQTPKLQALVEYHSMSFDLLGHGDPRRVQTGVVSADFFNVLGVMPMLGRTFLTGEDQDGAAPVLVLSYQFWVNELGADSSIIGKTFTMNDRSHTVVGILPPLPSFPNRNDVWMPISSCPFRSAPRVENSRTVRMVSLLAELPPTETAAQAQQDLHMVEQRMHAEYPAAYKNVADADIKVTPLHSSMTNDARPALLLLLGIAGLVLLVACINVAHLTLARQLARQREMAIRTALGAGRRRLLRQLLVESLLLSVVGGALGLGVARVALSGLTQFASRMTSRADDIVLDWRVMLFTLGVALIAGIAFAVVPALGDRTDVVTRLRDGGGATTGAGRVRLRGALVVGEVALAFVVLIGAGLALRSFAKMLATAPGYDPQDVITARVDLNFTKYAKFADTRGFTTALLDRLRAAPGVTAVALANEFPASSSQPQNLNTFTIRGSTVSDSAHTPRAEVNFVSPDYFKVLGVPMVSGGGFAGGADRDTANVSVVVSAAAARRYFPNGDALGKQITLGGDQWATIAGIAGDVRQFGPAADVAEELYIPYWVQPVRDIRVLVRSNARSSFSPKLLERIVHQLDPQQPVIQVETLEDARRDVLASRRQTTFLLGAFAVLALVIATAGLGGVIAYSVGQRGPEFGIRMALGAERSSILGLVLRQGVRLVLVGVVLGAAASMAFGAGVAKLFSGVGRTDPITYAGVSLVFLVVAILACLIPARRATAIDPASAFKAS